MAIRTDGASAGVGLGGLRADPLREDPPVGPQGRIGGEQGSGYSDASSYQEPKEAPVDLTGARYAQAGSTRQVTSDAQSTGGPPRHVVYLGINHTSREKEGEIFSAKGQGATVIKGSGDPKMEGKTLAADQKTVLDLGKEADVKRYLDETGVGKPRPGETQQDAQERVKRLTQVFVGMTPNTRDEMAQLTKVAQSAQDGKINLDRVVVSGHSTGPWVYDEDGSDKPPGVEFKELGEVMREFPKAQGQVKHLMLSACHTLENYKGDPPDVPAMDTRSGSQYKDIFPNLKTVWGYNGVSPSADQGSAQHIRNWLAASESGDVGAIRAAATRAGQHAKVKVY